MATFIITRPTITRPSALNYTAGSDYIRGSGNRDILGYSLSSAETAFLQPILNANPGLENLVYDFFFLGQFGSPVPNYAAFNGDDRIYGRGGDDYIVDLRGNNLVVTEEGDDRILLGTGNDRIYDQGGDNVIDDLGGNNAITTGDGNDTITTGDGNDNINAFDGRNVIEAGGGTNRVYGGNGFDQITVGAGDDFVDVRGGFFGEDLDGDGVIDIGEDRNFNGVLEPPDQVFLDLPNIGLQFVANNLVIDGGGSDTIRASASNSRQGDDVVLSDVEVEIQSGVSPTVGEFQVITLTGAVPGGDDSISLGAGDNLVIDAGGNNTVSTLQGDDIIFTSFVFAGNDTIDTGAGSDRINPGSGADVIRPGPGDDFIFLENDGDPDRLVYRAGVNGAVGDEVPASVAGAALTDIVTGFDVVGGIDKIDMRAFDVDFTDAIFFDAAALGVSAGGAGLDLLIAWDTNDTGALDTGDIFTTILADVTAIPDASNFLFDTAIA